MKKMSLLLGLAVVSLNCNGDSECIKPTVTAYRGTVKTAPENTIAAFEYALEHKAEAIETDVQLTSDGELILFHDETTGRTSDDQTDGEVVTYSLAEMQALDVGSWFSDDFAGATVPEIAELVDISEGDTIFIFDMKTDEVVEPLAEFIEGAGIAERVIVSSFSTSRLIRMKELVPAVTIGYCMTSTEDDQWAAAKEVNAKYVRIPKADEKDESYAEKAVGKGMLPAVSARYLSWEVGMILADDVAGKVAERDDAQPAECK